MCCRFYCLAAHISPRWQLAEKVDFSSQQHHQYHNPNFESTSCERLEATVGRLVLKALLTALACDSGWRRGADILRSPAGNPPFLTTSSVRPTTLMILLLDSTGGLIDTADNLISNRSSNKSVRHGARPKTRNTSRLRGPAQICHHSTRSSLWQFLSNQRR